jgi:hypothetical protein
MKVEQRNDRLTFRQYPYGWNIAIGFLIITVATLFLFAVLEAIRLNDTFWYQIICLFSILLSVGFMFLGVFMTFLRPKVFIFDRAMGELTVIQKTLFSKTMKQYPLSGIKAIVLEGYIPSGFGQEITPLGSIFVVMIMQRNSTKNSLKYERLVITGRGENYQSKQAKAHMVASFLGLSVQEKIKW